LSPWSFGLFRTDSEAPLVVASQLKQSLFDERVCFLGKILNRPEAFSAKLIVHGHKLS
jgi:hypothetical protein